MRVVRDFRFVFSFLKNKEIVLLPNYRWNDYCYITTFTIYFPSLGSRDMEKKFRIKIAKKGMLGWDKLFFRNSERPLKVDQLDENYYSLGNEEYYKYLAKHPQKRQILTALNDIVFSQRIYRTVQNERAYKLSFLRSVTANDIEYVFKQYLADEVPLTNIDIRFTQNS